MFTHRQDNFLELPVAIGIPFYGTLDSCPQATRDAAYVKIDEIYRRIGDRNELEAKSGFLNHVFDWIKADPRGPSPGGYAFPRLDGDECAASYIDIEQKLGMFAGMTDPKDTFNRLYRNILYSAEDNGHKFVGNFRFLKWALTYD